MRLRFLYIAATLFCVSFAAHASPVFTFTFVPAAYTVGQSGQVQYTATIVNTGTTDITGLSGYYTVGGTIAPYRTQTYFGTPTQTIASEFAGIDLKPGGMFTFVFETSIFANAPVGLYTGLANSSISLSDSSGGTPFVASTNEPMLNVIAATPEPSSFALLGTGLLGIAGSVRRRLA